MSPGTGQAAGAVARERVEPARGLDLLALPVVGRFLRWRHARLAVQLPVGLVALAMVLHGLLGPQLAPRNLATLLGWVHYRGALVFVLLVAGNLFCLGCPFLLPRELARRFTRPVRSFPRVLRGKWIAAALLVAVLFSYELFDLWGSPWWTAWLVVGYFAAALTVDAFFRGAPFCKHLCPIGQFNFVASTVSPLEVQVRDADACGSCRTKDCIRGRRDPRQPEQVLQRGCELGLYLPRKTGNLDCTFCLDCVHACPHDNVALATRPPASELLADPVRSGLGRLSRRPDLAALAALFTFGALLNAFGMVGPVYTLERWIASGLGLTREAPVLGLIFLVGLVLEPLLLLGLAAWATRRAGVEGSLAAIARRFVWVLVPFGFAVWLAHYGFHLLTGLLTFVPVVEDALGDLGLPLGRPHWGLGGLSPAQVLPLEMGLLALGTVGSLAVAWRLSEQAAPRRAAQAFLPWAVLLVTLCASAVWLLTQPMEMRGTFLAS